MDEVRLAYYQRQVEMETDRLEQDVPSDIHSDDEFVAEEPIQHFMQTILWSLDKLEDKVQRLSEDELLLDKHRVQDVKNDLTAMKERISEVLPELIKSSREMHNKSPTADDSNDPMPEKNENKGVKKIDVTDINFTWPIDERKTFKALTKKVKESPIYADLLVKLSFINRKRSKLKCGSSFAFSDRILPATKGEPEIEFLFHMEYSSQSLSEE